jgi:hypothetical protein
LTRAGITSANINNSKYLFLSDDCSVDGINDDGDAGSIDVVFPALWILNPKRNDDVPIRRETKVRIFCVMAGMIVTGAPMLVSCCALAELLSRSNKDRVDINKTNNTKTTKQLIMIFTKLDPYLVSLFCFLSLLLRFPYFKLLSSGIKKDYRIYSRKYITYIKRVF